MIIFSRFKSPSRRSADNTFFIYDDGEVSSDIWIVVDSYGHALSLRSRLISTLRGLSILSVVSAASASTMSTIPTATSPDISDVQFVWIIFPSGFVNHNLDYTISYSYGLSPFTDGFVAVYLVNPSGFVYFGFNNDANNSYGKIALRRRIAPAMRTVSTLMVTSATAMVTVLTVIPTDIFLSI